MLRIFNSEYNVFVRNNKVIFSQITVKFCVCVCFSHTTFILYLSITKINHSLFSICRSEISDGKAHQFFSINDASLVSIIIVIVILFSTTKDSQRSVRIKRTKSVCYVQTFIWPPLAFYSKRLGGYLVDIEYLVYIQYLVYMQYSVYIQYFQSCQLLLLKVILSVYLYLPFPVLP